jgi:hypothetical protein
VFWGKHMASKNHLLLVVEKFNKPTWIIGRRHQCQKYVKFWNFFNGQGTPLE